MKRAFILALVLTLCLATIGVAYAVWGEDVYIDGSASTGYSDIEWSLKSFSDNDGNPGWGEVTASISDDMNTLNIEITNAYPGYEATINCDLHNVGTVPATVGDMDMTDIPDELTIQLIGDTFANGTVLYPCEEKIGTIKVLVNPSAEPSSKYAFNIIVDPGPWSP